MIHVSGSNLDDMQTPTQQYSIHMGIQDAMVLMSLKAKEAARSRLDGAGLEGLSI